MKYLFLGLLFDKEKEAEYLENSKKGLQNAINLFQFNLIDGMLQNDAEVDIINVLPVGAFPKQYKKLILHSREWKYKNCTCFECGCVNVPVLKQLFRRIKIYSYIKKWIKENKEEEKAVIAYSYYLPFLKALVKLSGKKKTMTSLIVPDLPAQYGILPKNKIKAYISKKYGEKVLRYSQKIDSFIFFTKHMSTALGLQEKRQTVIEGICPTVLNQNSGVKEMDKKVIFYSGTLNRKFGIRTLLEAFQHADIENTELWICGSGEDEKEVISYAKRDKRIVFLGYCSSEKVSELRNKASVLVNPRQNKGEYTKYSFPSKTLEYMASGRPVVMYKLDGIPDEYDPYLFYVKEEGAAALGEKLKEVCEMKEEERKAFGERAQSFALDEKNPKKQAQKLLQLLEERRNA